MRTEQSWKLEMTAYCHEGDSVVFDRNGDQTELKGRQAEMILELMDAAEKGVDTVWYGNVENAEPVNIAAAVADIMQLDSIGDGNWGEWPEG